MRTTPAVVSLLTLFTLLAGCSQPAPATSPTAVIPSATQPRTAITTQILGQVLNEHVADSFAIWGGTGFFPAAPPTGFVDGLQATSYLRATPAQPARWLTVQFSPTPWPGSIGCEKNGCTERDGVFIREKGNDIVARRDVGLVRVSGSPDHFSGDLLSIAIDVAKDPRIEATVEQSLADAAAANPRWRDDVTCAGTRTVAPIPLPASAGEAQRVTPQALAALVSSRVSGSCIADESVDDLTRGVVYLGDDKERVSLSISSKAFRCPQLDTCSTENSVTVAKQLDVPEDQPARIVLARPAADGTHWVLVEQTSGSATSSHEFPVATDVLRAIVTDPRVEPSVDAALNQAGDALPLPWRLIARTAE